MPLIDRKYVDGFVCFAHAISIGALYGSDPSFIDKIVGRLLMMMEIVTILFHFFYSLSFNCFQGLSWTPKIDAWNGYKWLEYAISATLGTFAVAYAASDTPNFDGTTQLLLAAAGIAQQSTGYQLEKIVNENGQQGSRMVGFFSASLLQIGELFVVGTALDVTNSDDYVKIAFSTYAIGYLTFGVIMAAVLLMGVDDEAGIRDAESVYSLAGLIAKLGVLFGDYTVYAASLGGSIAVLTVVTVIVVATLYHWFRPRGAQSELRKWLFG